MAGNICCTQSSESAAGDLIIYLCSDKPAPPSQAVDSLNKYELFQYSIVNITYLAHKSIIKFAMCFISLSSIDVIYY
jgi:hypothetical protein